MPPVRVSTKGQIVLPAEMRRRYGMEPGTVVEVVDAGDHVVVVPHLTEPVAELRGILGRKTEGEKPLTEALLESRRAEAARERADGNSPGHSPE